MFISVEQIKAARALLGWNQKDLARAAGLNDDQVQSFESGRTRSLDVLEAIYKALSENGIEFADGGVLPRQTRVKTLGGAAGLQQFMDDVYQFASTTGGEICLHNAKPSNWVKWLGQDWFEYHNKRMLSSKGNYQLKITARSGDVGLLADSYAEYRWIPEKLWDEKSFYVYGDNIGFIDFNPDSVDVFVLKQKKFADSFRSLFNVMWEKEAVPPSILGGKK